MSKSTRTLITEKYGTRIDIMLVRELLHALLMEKRTSCATQRTVCFNKDAFLTAEVCDVLLRKVRICDSVRFGQDPKGLSRA